jgi:hypothetical protein
MKPGKIVRLFLLVFAVLIGAIFFLKYDGKLECVFYYDHCFGERIKGLTKEQCFAKENSAAYLLENNECLLQAN